MPLRTAHSPSRTRWCAALLLAGVGFSANAAMLSIAVTNGDFESNAVSDGIISISTTPTGWQSNGSTFGVYNPATNGGQYSAAGFSSGTGVVGSMSGSTVAFFYQADGSYIQQASGHDVVAGETYSLTVSLGGRTLSNTNQGAAIQLWDGNSLLASLLVTDITRDTFEDRTLTYVAQAGDSGKLTIRLLQQQAGYADFDNVRLAYEAASTNGGGQPLPVPGTALLAGLALLAAHRVKVRGR
jgi:hypothetical protein